MIGPRYDADRVDQRDDERIRRLSNWLGPRLTRYHRAEVRGVERLPAESTLIVGNHNGGPYTPDTWLLCDAICRAHGVERVPFGLGHQLVLDMPLLNQALVPLGGVRAAPENARKLFDAGHNVLVYPGGDEDAMRPYRRRDEIVFGGRRGYIRIALEAGVPLVPVVAAGAHSTFIVIDDLKWLARASGVARRLRLKVWPITLTLPWGISVVGPFLPYIPFPSRILVEVLEPIRFDWTGPAAADDEAYVFACAARVEGVMQRALTRLADERRMLERTGR